jgi:DNA-binding FadR family transcriptional regulator
MIRPTPQDVLAALPIVDPNCAGHVARKNTSKRVNNLRRAAIAAARALGHSYQDIGLAFDRDERAVRGHCCAYCNIQRNGPHAALVREQMLFKRIHTQAMRIAQGRGE